MNARNLVFSLLFASAALAQEMAPVVVKMLDRKLKLPAEVQPFQAVDVVARVPSFVEKVLVDRGSVVKKGELLIELSAPELKAQLLEHEARALAVESQKAEAAARLAGLESTYVRLKEAAATPGAIALNEVVVAEKNIDAQKALIRSIDTQAAAARSSSAAVREMLAFLKIEAPFDGVITERKVHPGAIAGPTTGMLLHLEQVSKLRMVVFVPESEVSGIARGASVPFSIAGGVTGFGIIARPARSLDPRSRTMPVELDVANAAGAIAPGMYAEVVWPVRHAKPSILVPPSAVVTTSERIFVIRNKGGKAEYVPVARGAAAGELLEVFGALHDGDKIVKRGTDEIRQGQALQ